MTQNRYCRTQGGFSKAAASREIVRRMAGSPNRAVISVIQSELGFSRAMARHYFYCAQRAVDQDQYRGETVQLSEVQNVHGD